MSDDLELQRLRDKYEISQAFDPRRFIPPGPVARAFMVDDVLTPFLMGPVGGGKTVACAFKRLIAATKMPACSDGVIRDRWIVVRSTYRAAEKTVLASWLQWFPKTYPGSTWSGGNDRPATHTLRFRTPAGRLVEAETQFIGLNGQRIEDALRGFEISGAWANEADTLDEEALRYLEQRTGRYPSRAMMPEGAPRYRQVIGDLNAPDIDNWVYKIFVEGKSDNRVLYAQPSGQSAEAENIGNLERGYYDQMVADNEDWFVQRMVHNRFGYSRDGKPVYDTFSHRVHVAPSAPLVDPNGELLIGMDGGSGTLNPAAVFGQLHSGWQLRILRELVPGHGVGPSRFGEMVAAVIEQRFPNVRSIRGWCDPAAQYGADREDGQLAWMEIVATILGVPLLVPFGGSNEIGMRTDAVKAELKTDGSQPNMLISPDCPLLIRGFASKYRYKKRPAGASGEFEDKPEKNDASHPHDALQYLVGGVRGRQAIVRGDQRRRGRDRGEERAEAAGGWSQGGSVSRGAPAAGGRRGFDPHRAG